MTSSTILGVTHSTAVLSVRMALGERWLPREDLRPLRLQPAAAAAPERKEHEWRAGGCTGAAEDLPKLRLCLQVDLTDAHVGEEGAEVLAAVCDQLPELNRSC